MNNEELLAALMEINDRLDGLKTWVTKLADTQVEIAQVATEYAEIDGAHHKQWALAEIMRLCGLEMPEDEGEAV